MASRFRADWEHERFYAGERRYFPRYMYRQNLPEDAPEMAADPWVQQSGYRMYERRCLIPFENRWELSVIWGDHTYSSNYPWPWKAGRIRSEPFIEAPTAVEVGVLAPWDNERGHPLMGQPLAYVDVEQFNQVATVVSAFPSGEPPASIPEDWDTESFLDWAKVWAMSFNEEHM
jgi:hypothetical protein